MKSGHQLLLFSQLLAAFSLTCCQSDDLNGILEMSDLGRRFTLGCLYDARSDQIIPGYSLWNSSTIDIHTQKRINPGTNFRTIATDDFNSKADVFDLSASLQASFLNGLVEVKGAAEYLRDNADSNHKSRVSLFYAKETHLLELGSDLQQISQIEYPQVFDSKVATHLVTKVYYGAKVTTIFEGTVEDLKKVKHVHGELEIAVKLASGALDIQGHGSITANGSEIKKYSKFNVKFYGDVEIPLAPTTYQTTLDVYKSLPGLVNEQTAVPIRVNMIPLKSIDSKSSQILRQINALLLGDVESRLAKYEELSKSIGDLEHHSTVYSNLPSMRMHIRAFKNAVEVDKNIFQSKIAELLPLIRGGHSAEEQQLNQILQDQNKSPYNLGLLKMWIDDKKREAGAMHIMFTTDESLVATSPGELEKLLYDTAYEHIMAISLELYPIKDKYTTCMLDRNSTSCVDVDRYRSWRNTEKINHDIHQKFTWLQNLRDSNRNNNNSKVAFAIAEHTPLALDARAVTLRWYRRGELKKRDFEPPRVEKLTNKVMGRFVELSWTTEGTISLITGYNILFRAFPNGTWKHHHSKQPLKHSFKIRLPGKMPEFDFDQQYLFEIRVQPACEFGYGVAGITKIKPVKCWSPWIFYDTPLMVDGPTVLKHGVNDSTIAIVGWEPSHGAVANIHEDDTDKGVPEIYLMQWDGNRMKDKWQRTWLKSRSTPALIPCSQCPLRVGIFFRKYGSGHIWYSQLSQRHGISVTADTYIQWPKVFCCRSWTHPVAAIQKYGSKQVHLFVTELDGTLTHRSMSYRDIKKGSTTIRKIQADTLLGTGSGTVVTSSAAAAFEEGNKLNIFIRGGTQTNYTNLLRTAASVGGNRHNNPTFSNEWLSMNVSMLYAPAVVSQSGRIDVFFVDEEQSLNHYYYIQSLRQWYGPHSLGGVLTSAPVAVSLTVDSIDVFARGANMKLAHIQYRDKWCHTIRGIID